MRRWKWSTSSSTHDRPLEPGDHAPEGFEKHDPITVGRIDVRRRIAAARDVPCSQHRYRRRGGDPYMPPSSLGLAIQVISSAGKRTIQAELPSCRAGFRCGSPTPKLSAVRQTAPVHPCIIQR